MISSLIPFREDYPMKLIVIDMQKGLVVEDLYSYDSFVKNVCKLIDCARKNKVEVIYIQHDDGEGSGLSEGDEAFEIADKFKPKNNEIFIRLNSEIEMPKESKSVATARTAGIWLILG